MEKKIYTLNALAKINIGLRVLGKRKDGYHNIETIFYPINLNDIITLQIYESKKPSISVSTLPSGLINQKYNICAIAITSFLSEFNINNFYNINVSIKKNIPIGAGLGGGSSDAATVLKGLCEHFNFSKREDTLNRLALSLGSDVPFFLHRKAVYATSRGEAITVLPNLKINKKILVINPGIDISTKWAYRSLNITEDKKILLKDLAVKLNSKNLIDVINEHKSVFENDFEKIIFYKYPEIKIIKDELLSFGAIFASMSGSGSTMYGFFDEDVHEIQKYYKEKGYKVYLV